MRAISFGYATLLVCFVNVNAFSAHNNNALCLRSTIKVVARKEKYHSKSKEDFLLENSRERSSAATVLSLSPVDSIISVPTMALASLAPSLVGYYKTEYGVSYAYGTAVASIAWLVLRQLTSFNSLSSIAGVHSLSLLVYGIRLNLFLLYREVKIPYFRKFRERIEDRTKSKGSRLSRTPFILSVALLYFCLGIPIVTTGSALQQVPFWSTDGGLKLNALRFLVGTTCFGFLVAMIGDTTKTRIKAKEGEDHLVTGGIFRKLRHPNYTGEIFAWTASALTACLVGGVNFNSIASIFGAMGINFVLVQAATGLERKQKEKYGDSERYQNWIQGSWAGVTMKGKKKESS